MIDVIFVAVLVALFLITVGFVQVCDRLIGSDEEAFADAPAEETSPEQRLAA